MNILKKINPKVAAGIMLIASAGVVVFHVLVLARLIPYDIVWGGRLESVQQMIVFEGVSLAINLAIIAVVGIRGGFVKPIIPGRVVTICLWVLVAIFALNTVGNLFAKTTLETILFTPVTLGAAVLSWRLAIEGRGKTN